MSLFSDLINRYIKELEDLKVRLNIEIEGRLRRKADEVLASYTEQITNIQSQITLERERILYESLVSSRRELANLLEQLLNDIIKNIYEYIDRNRTNERYIRFLENILIKVKEYIGSEAVIYASPKDKNAVDILMRKVGIRGSVNEGDLKGGAIASSPDGSIKLDMSIESLIQSNLEELKRIIYSKL
ncbi:MAG: V-type ATP synthase subunit E [Thermoproteus sp.]|nr:V-type ATP synthase subunit E [Thermoproteus sp.]